MAYTKYSLTPSSNTAAPPDGAPEGMLPSAVNDTMRDMMAQIRDCGDGIRDGTYTMTAPKITGGTITGAAFTGNTFTSPVISGGTINNATIGATTATTGKFTTLEATGVATFSAGAVGTPAITTTGDTNTGIFFPAADTIAFTEGGVESMRITSTGDVGIGTSSPSSRLDVVGSAAAASATIKVGANGNGGIIWRNESSTSVGYIQVNAADVEYRSVNGSTGAWLQKSGISFPATQVASADANTLDDYEEGTFTPTIAGGTTDGTATYSAQVGQYTKIGNRVFFIIRLGWSSGTGTGALLIKGLPFTQFNGSGDLPYAASEWSDIAWSANYSPTPVGAQNTTFIYLNQSRIGGSGAGDNTTYDAAGFMSLTGHYRIN